MISPFVCVLYLLYLLYTVCHSWPPCSLVALLPCYFVSYCSTYWGRTLQTNIAYPHKHTLRSSLLFPWWSHSLPDFGYTLSSIQLSEYSCTRKLLIPDKFTSPWLLLSLLLLLLLLQSTFFNKIIWPHDATHLQINARTHSHTLCRLESEESERI